MRALFVQQDHVSPVGPVGAAFEERGFEVEEFLVVPEHRFHAPDVAVTFPDASAYDVIVPMGAPWSVYDEETIGAWVLEELTFLRRAHDAGIPVLGICFGGQALAAALGGAVERAPEAEIGWVTVDTDDPGLVEPGPWFEWHHDRWSAPPGARTFARTGAAEQAFRIGRSLAVQFHPELTPAQLKGWLDNGGTAYLEAHDLDPALLVAETERTADEAQARSRALVHRFLDQVAFPS
ncbi:MAG: aminotransferase [Frankiales bacterium]|nr:aminotransferase [Frankiales bacterium]